MVREVHGVGAEQSAGRFLYEELGFASEADMQQARAQFAKLDQEQDVARAQQLRAELLDSFIASVEHEIGGGNAALKLEIDQGQDGTADDEAELAKRRDMLLSPDSNDETAAEREGRRRFEDAEMAFRRMDRPATPDLPLAPTDATPVFNRDGQRRD